MSLSPLLSQEKNLASVGSPLCGFPSSPQSVSVCHSLPEGTLSLLFQDMAQFGSGFVYGLNPSFFDAWFFWAALRNISSFPMLKLQWVSLVYPDGCKEVEGKTFDSDSSFPHLVWKLLCD